MASYDSIPPIRIPALDNTSPEKAATFIFLHGLGDDGEGWKSKFDISDSSSSR